MRKSVQMALFASALSAGCATDRGAEYDCCRPAPSCRGEAPGRCVVQVAPGCLEPVPGAPAPEARQPAPQPAPRPPVEPSPEPAPEPPLPPTALFDEGEPETQPVSTIAAEPVYGHAPDYRWLRGELQRVHVPGGEWKLRYAPLDQRDRWGGSVVLATDIRLDSYADGNLVYVEGEILAARPSLYLSGPLYRVRTIRSAEPPKRERVAGQLP